jgi:5-methylcytosine-specific restriction protein A
MAQRIKYFRPAGVPAKPSRIDPQAVRRAEDNRFYQRAQWKRVRAIKLDQNPLCEECESKGLTVLAEQVHHIRPRKLFPDLAFDLANLQALCRSCHTREEKSRKA